ncbi:MULTISPECIES: MurR/RpiR family transcriptional regulator [Fusobacterium]|uniref:MurR/RpiR family transcriptional regulator n=1 Tax=Fusobacterium TaxID=848 RepID=UPI00147720C5|nr:MULTISPECIES: MurR/RpiR family transcriptional regulator [Fusobacterium]NME36638.1 MurR/RpiR family transcriptional regulator [Fusobacterium sp. FSA-380-WT-3A]
MNNLILKLVKENMDNFTKQQKKIAQYLLEHYEEAVFFTAEELGEKSKTSEPTVVRFVKKIGFSKYSDLQNELRKVLKGKLYQVDRLNLPTEKNDLLSFVAYSMNKDIESIRKTLKNINESDLNKAIDWLLSSEKVFIVATHAEYGLACYFGHSLSWIRDKVFVLTTLHGMNYDEMYNITEKDLLVAISFPPYPKYTVDILNFNFLKGIRTLGITDNENSPISLFSNCCLYAHNEQISFVDNSAPTLSLLSVILTLVSKKDLNRANKKLEKLTKFWESSNLYYKK